MPKLIQVIENEETVGDGSQEHPFIVIRRYYTPDGKLLGSSQVPTPEDLAKDLAKPLAAIFPPRQLRAEVERDYPPR